MIILWVLLCIPLFVICEKPNIIFISNNPFHDRYIVLDRKEVYISGMSLKDIGKKYTYINKVNENIFINELLTRINDVL